MTGGFSWLLGFLCFFFFTVHVTPLLVALLSLLGRRVKSWVVWHVPGLLVFYAESHIVLTAMSQRPEFKG